MYLFTFQQLTLPQYPLGYVFPTDGSGLILAKAVAPISNRYPPSFLRHWTVRFRQSQNVAIKVPRTQTVNTSYNKPRASHGAKQTHLLILVQKERAAAVLHQPRQYIQVSSSRRAVNWELSAHTSEQWSTTILRCHNHTA